MKLIRYNGYQVVAANEEAVKRITEVLDAQGVHYTVGDYEPVRYEAAYETRVVNTKEER